MIAQPAPCPGTQPYNRRTGAQLAWWVTREHLKKPSTSLLAAATAAAIATVAWRLGTAQVIALLVAGLAVFYLPVAAGTIAVHMATLRRWKRDGWLVGYFTAHASQLVHPDNGQWVLSEHHARRRGRGWGAQLRAVVWPHLVGEADRAGVGITMATRSPQLAAHYMQDMPGLRIDRSDDRGTLHIERPPS